MDAGIEWTGQSPSEAAERLEQLQNELSAGLDGAMEEISLRVMADARREAPVDTGRLRSSIDQEVEQVAEHTVRAVVGSNVEYAPVQEVSQPYLRPAFEANKEFIRERITAAVENAVGAAA